MTHNQFSEEVARERESQRDYGGPKKARNRRPSPSSYKQQALQELASRLILEDENDDLRNALMRLENKLEMLTQA